MNSRALRPRHLAAPLIAALLAAAPLAAAPSVAQADERSSTPIAASVAPAAPAAPGNDRRARIVLKASAALPGSAYTLGDIADVESPDAALRERLSALPIGALPRQGYADTVTRARLQARVRGEPRLDDVQWSGAARCRGRSAREFIGAGCS